MNKYEQYYIEQKRSQEDMEKRVILLKTEIRQQTRNLSRLVDARDIVNIVTLATQKQAQGIIEEIITSILYTLYGSGYEAKLKFEVKRNKTEITPVLLKDGSERDLKKEVGGGIVDVFSFGMRLVLWAMSMERTDNCLFLDEPFKNLGIKAELMSEILKKLSDKFGLQIIIITHDERLMVYSDKSCKVSQSKGISKVEEI